MGQMHGCGYFPPVRKDGTGNDQTGNPLILQRETLPLRGNDNHHSIIKSSTTIAMVKVDFGS